MPIITLNNEVLSLSNKALFFDPTKYLCLYSISSTSDGGTSSCACLCVKNTPAMSGADSYCLCLGASLSTVNQGANSCACVQVLCNGTSIYCCTAAANTCVPSLCKPLTVTNTDCVHMILYAVTTNIACSGCANSFGNILGVSSISGCFAIGSPSSCQKYTG